MCCVRHALAASMCLLSIACSRIVWEKPGATVRDLDHAAAECQKAADALNTHFGTTKTGGYVERCMEARGWTMSRELSP